MSSVFLVNRGTERTLPLNAGEFWSTVGDKLSDALKTNENDDYAELIKRFTDCSLSLFAVAKGPRTRLLYITLQRLHNEAGIDSIIYFYFQCIMLHFSTGRNFNQYDE